MIIRNVDDAPYSEKHGTYGGASGLKDGLIIDGQDWIVKYPKNAAYLSRHEEMSYTNDPVSEYLGSHIYELLGYPVHETMLVERRNKIAVACKDFINDSAREKLLEIRTIKNSANEQLADILERDFGSTGSAHVVNFEELMLHLKHNDILTRVDGIKERFFDMLVVDIFINNSDRNNGNWGIIRTPGQPDRLAPVFDNGGSFNGKTPDSRLARMAASENIIKSSIINGITSFGKNNVPFLSKEMIKMDIPELHQAIKKNVPKIKENMTNIYHLIDELPDRACSQVRKAFYKQTLAMRLELILEPEYQKITNVPVKKVETSRENNNLSKVKTISSILTNRSDGEPYKNDPEEYRKQTETPFSPRFTIEKWKAETDTDKLYTAVLCSNGHINYGRGLEILKAIMENENTPEDALIMVAGGKLDNQGKSMMTNADVISTWEHILNNKNCPAGLAADILLETVMNQNKIEPELAQRILDKAHELLKSKGYSDIAGVTASFQKGDTSNENLLIAVGNIMEKRLPTLLHKSVEDSPNAPGGDMIEESLEQDTIQLD